jgi:hypothetical protein
MATCDNSCHTCQYCKFSFSDKTAVSRHVNHFCKLVPDIKAKLIEKQQRRKKKSVKQEISINQAVNIDKSINIGNTTTNTTNNINIQFINICGSNVPEDVIKSIKEINEASIDKLRQYIPNLLQPFGSENMNQILDNAPKIIRYYNNSPSETFSQLLNDIHKIDENRNFAVPNVKYAIVQYVNDKYDIAKENRQEHIYNIQVQMHSVYANIYDRYKSEIRPKYYEAHEIFLKNMLRRYVDVVDEFKLREKEKLREEIRKLKEECDENSEVFDDRSILNRPERACDIPDYNKITKEIIETYLTTNSKVNVQYMNEHKDKVCAIKSAIADKEIKNVVRLRDFIEETKLLKKQEIAKKKILELAEKHQILLPQIDYSTQAMQEEDEQLLAELEAARGAD